MSTPGGRHPQLSAAAVLVAAEALGLAAIGVAVVLAGTGARLVLDATTTLFFLGCAAGLLVCARGLWRRRAWARGPVVFAQLIQLGVAWSFASGGTLPIALALVAVAGGVLGLVLAPASTRALGSDVPEES